MLVALGSSALLSRDTTCSVGTKAIIEVMEKTGVSKISVCSSFGVGPGNRPLVPWIARVILYFPLADKDVQEDHVVKSSLDYTIVRPTHLVDDAPNGNIHAIFEGPLPTMKISRADTATFMLSSLFEEKYSKKIVSISWSA